MTTSRIISTFAASAAVALAATSVVLDHAASAAGGQARPVAAKTPRLAPKVSARPRQQADTVETYAYRWPVKPFDRQHPVRGFFGDPRIANHGKARQFHFGIDISAPNGTPVYASLSGRVYIHPLHDTTVAIVAGDGTEFSYWHVVPIVRTGEHVVAYRTVIGHIEAPYGHVHFSERRSGRYLNPLRPGALGPYSDSTTPSVHSAVLTADGSLVAEAYDETPMAVPRPWQELPVMPAVVRWRLIDGHGDVVTSWRTTVDFRVTIPAASEFDRTWAPGVSQNHVRAPGRYRLILARSSELTALHALRCIVEIAVSDTRGNGSRRRVALDALVPPESEWSFRHDALERFLSDRNSIDSNDTQAASFDPRHRSGAWSRTRRSDCRRALLA